MVKELAIYFYHVERESTLHTWVAVWGFGVPGDTIPLFQDVHAQLGLGPHLPCRYYLGTFQGKPTLHSVVTLPEARSKGIGTAMTLAALREARRAGYRVAILTASPYGERIYRRVGFREYCTISRYTKI